MQMFYALYQRMQMHFHPPRCTFHPHNFPTEKHTNPISLIYPNSNLSEPCSAPPIKANLFKYLRYLHFPHTRSHAPRSPTADHDDHPPSRWRTRYQHMNLMPASSFTRSWTETRSGSPRRSSTICGRRSTPRRRRSSLRPTSPIWPGPG